MIYTNPAQCHFRVYILGYSFPGQGVYSGLFIPMSRCIFGDTHSHFKVYIQGYPFPFQGTGTCIYSRFFFLTVDKYLCSTVNKAFILDVTVDCGCSMSWIYEFLLWLRILSTSCSVESMSLSFSLYDTFSLKFSFGFFFFFFFFFLLVPRHNLLRRYFVFRGMPCNLISSIAYTDFLLLYYHHDYGLFYGV